MSELQNVVILAGNAILYFGVLAALFRARGRLGMGAFFCALGVMHFLETYLASTLYVPLPLGIVASPGSSVLFTGKLMLLLLVYIREDAVVVRQPIYGLLIGNLLLFALGVLLRGLDHGAVAAGADFGFLDQMGALMVWGTAILFIDCIIIILLYERSRAWLGDHVFARLLLSGVVVLTFDQAAFFAGLHVLTGAGVSVLLGGWAAKMGAVALYSVLAALYLRHFERSSRARQRTPRVGDVFDTLTYRERYEELLARVGRDPLTGALDRGQLDAEGQRLVNDALWAGRPLSLILIDIDHFRTFNDRYGHAAGDAVLKRIARDISGAVRDSDLVFRFGGEEFLVLADGLAATPALALGERIRRAVTASGQAMHARVTVSIGIATCSDDAAEYEGLFAAADRRLYQAKAAGQDCVVGAPSVPDDAPPRLAEAS